MKKSASLPTTVTQANSSRTSRKQSGAVSIFMVVFAILLMSVVTISFLRIMVSDQSQASGNDLAQSAYDSAQAGVEDGKRALLWYVNTCKADASTCATNAAKIASTQCNYAVTQAGVASAPESGGVIGEVKVQATADATDPDSALNQAYTCVTMQLKTDDYVGTLSVNSPALVPLVVESGSTVKRVKVEWFSRDDISSDTSAVVVPSTATGPLVAQTEWSPNEPPVLRAQYMQVGDTFSLKDFDYYDDASSKSNTNTLFLYPTTAGSNAANLVTSDIRANSSGNVLPASSSNTPYPTKCVTSLASGGYACSMTLTVPAPIGSTSAKTAYLLLTPFYTGTHFRVSLEGDSGPLQFDAVQPLVDSTGRASDVFRRVQTRVDLYPTTPYINGAVDVNGSFCKDFGVTDTQYIPGSGTCTP